jgi:phage terminase large subunit
MNKANLKVLLLRRTFPELEANHLIPLQHALKKVIKDDKGNIVYEYNIAEYKEAKKAFYFPNGSILKLGYCQYENDAKQYQGHEYDVIIFEEATSFTESMIKFISTALRSARPDFESRIYYTCNPGGPAHAYIKRLFIDREYEDMERPDDYEFIESLVYDNEIIMENDSQYIQLLNNLDPELRRAHRDGDWDALAGQYFREFKRQVHVTEPFTIPKEWKHYCSIDYGLDMFAVLFFAIDYNKNVYVYNEIHKKNLIISDAAKLLNSFLKTYPKMSGMYAPPDLDYRRQDTGKTALQLFSENGLVFDVSSNNRIAGWYNVKEMLKFTGKYEEKAQGYNITKKPIMHIFSNCKTLIKNLPVAQHDEKRPEDIASEPHEITHILDALRYFCVRWYTPPVKLKQGMKQGSIWNEQELLMKGYTKAEIDTMIANGLIKVGSYFGPPECISID